MEHENRCGLPWVYVRRYKGSYGTEIEALWYVEFDMHSKPMKDKEDHWIFSLKYRGKDICMVRCYGKKALSYALRLVHRILDETFGPRVEK